MLRRAARGGGSRGRHGKPVWVQSICRLTSLRPGQLSTAVATKSSSPPAHHHHHHCAIFKPSHRCKAFSQMLLWHHMTKHGRDFFPLSAMRKVGFLEEE